MIFFKFKVFLISIWIVLLADTVKKNPKILIIGDSISIGYTPFVQNELKGRADVYHNPGNAKHTGTGIENIEKWIGDQQWDIIQFNWGLWDLCYRHPDSKLYGQRDKINGKLTHTVEEYATNLDSIIGKIKAKSKAKLIFVTTTHIPDEEAGRFQQDALRYNEVAKRIMKEHNILVNDIYEQSTAIHKKYGIGSDDVHYSKQGYRKLGHLITDFLKREM